MSTYRAASLLLAAHQRLLMIFSAELSEDGPRLIFPSNHGRGFGSDIIDNRLARGDLGPHETDEP